MNVIGIDPGGSGAIAFNYEGEVEYMKLEDATERDIFNWLQDRVSQCRWHAFIEKVSSSPQMGVVSAFTFGRSYGMLRGLVIGLQVPFEEVTPQKWQKEMACLSKGDKNVTKARCQQLYPGIRATHAISDAILISEYGRRILNQRNGIQPTP